MDQGRTSGLQCASKTTESHRVLFQKPWASTSETGFLVECEKLLPEVGFESRERYYTHVPALMGEVLYGAPRWKSTLL